MCERKVGWEGASAHFLLSPGWSPPPALSFHRLSTVSLSNSRREPSSPSPPLQHPPSSLAREGRGRRRRVGFKKLGFRSDLGSKGKTSEAPERESEGRTHTHTHTEARTRKGNKWGETGRREAGTEGHKGLDWITEGQAHPHPARTLDL